MMRGKKPTREIKLRMTLDQYIKIKNMRKEHKNTQDGFYLLAEPILTEKIFVVHMVSHKLGDILFTIVREFRDNI